MVRIRHIIRLLPGLTLAACSGGQSGGQLPLPSGDATPGKVASAATVPSASTAHDGPLATPSAAQAPTTATLPVDASQLPPVASVPGVTCTQKRQDWTPECVAGDYEISVYADGCSADGFYGLVHTDGDAMVTLQTGFPPFPTTPVAKVREAQFVCVSAHARKRVGERLWLYVTAIPPEAVPACKDREICGKHGTPQVTWAGTAPKGACRLEHDRFVDCAAGWVSTSAVEEFSNGL